MTNYDTFLLTIQKEVRQFTDSVATEQGDWIVKGFIDVYQRVYAMPDDTKVTSKVLELFLIPRLIDFGKRNGYEVELAPQQNFYPDAMFISTTTARPPTLKLARMRYIPSRRSRPLARATIARRSLGCSGFSPIHT